MLFTHPSQAFRRVTRSFLVTGLFCNEPMQLYALSDLGIHQIFIIFICFSTSMHYVLLWHGPRDVDVVGLGLLASAPPLPTHLSF